PCAHPIRSLSRSDPPRSVLPPPSLHDALPIWSRFHDRLFDLLSGYSLVHRRLVRARARRHRLRHLPPSESRTRAAGARLLRTATDRKSTRLNSSHVSISYAVFCLKITHRTRSC